MIVLAERRFSFIEAKRLKELNSKANKILHAYQDHETLSKDDDDTILEFFKTLKFLIQRAPEPSQHKG